MRILHIINSLSSGGAQKLLEDFALLMDEFEDVYVEVLVLTYDKSMFDQELIKKGIKVYSTPYKSIRNPLNIFFIKRVVQKGYFDIVHVHLFPANYWSSVASKLIYHNKPKFITTEHNTHNRRRGKWYFRTIEKFIYSSFDKIISISNQTQENLLNWLEVNEKNLHKYEVIENGIYINKFNNARKYQKSELQEGIKSSDKLICMVGNFSKQKDQLTAIKAMERLKIDTHLLLVGDGELIQEKKELVKQIGLSNRVHFLGTRGDVSKVMKTSDIVLLSSHWEGFGLVAVEGMAAGKPLIATNIPGLKEVVYGAGILFEKGNAQDLSKKIDMLLSDEEKYNEVAEKCMERAKDFDIKKVVMKYMEVYKKS